MKGFTKKVVGLFLVLTLVMSLTACGGDDAGSTDSSTDTGTDTSADSGSTDSGSTDTDTDSGDDAEEVTLTLWSIATESDAFNPAYTNAIADYEAAHPGVTIVHETFENESYKTKIKTAVAANDLPDIFFTWGGGFSQAFVESEKVMPLDDYYADYSDELNQAALGNATYNGQIYGSTYSTPVSLLFYNKKMFDERGLTAPTTFEEWKTVNQAFLDDGITPIGISVKDTWVLAMTHDALTLKSAGPEKVHNVLTKTSGSYNDPDFINASASLVELIEMGALIEGAAGLSNDEASQLFYNGTVPMYITGSWMAGSIYTDSETPEDFDLAPIPVLNDENAQITDFMGGASDTLMVAASTEHPEEAGNAAFELARSISKYAYLDGAGVAAWNVDYDESDIKPLVQKVAQNARNATSFTLWFDTLMEAGDAGEYLALLQELYIGNLTPEEFVEAMADQLGQ